MDVMSTTCEVPLVQSEPVTAPSPAAYAYLKPANVFGFFYVGLACSLTGFGIFVSLASDSTWLWLAGQMLLAVGLLQWFVLLHEAGHNSLFRTQRFNRYAGRLAGFCALIPFGCWKLVHGMHHHWTGWQDLDMTTATLAPRNHSRLERLVVNVCWRLWIPLFSILYRVNNFWNLPRLRRIFPLPEQRRRLVGGVISALVLYGLLTYAVGPALLLKAVGLGLLLTLMMQDILILSQHTHVPMELSHGESARPFTPLEQEVFTRSLRFPRWFSNLVLLHVDAHELHHMYPFVPGYHLSKIRYQTHNEVPWLSWLWKARRLPADVFLFQNRRQSGADV
jgi:acyl-lipid omega-6 desaturase (Delta-12 desaturase)